MKRIFFVRHAKSSWEDASLPDYKRSLLSIGVERTKKVIDFLKKNEVHPDVILSSHAVRAQKTAELLAEGLLGDLNKISIHPEIYETNVPNILSVLYSLPEHVNEIVIVGHNPTITEMASYFSEKRLMDFSTSAVFGVEIQTTDWTEIHTAKRNTLFYINPKML
jgi:phosphohistidine phosphatase